MPETHTTTTAPAIVFPPGRYGRRRAPGRRVSRIASVAVALLLTAVAAYAGQLLYAAYGDGDYTASVTSYSDVTDSQVVITFLVRLPPGRSAICVVRARNAAGAEVGREEITVSPGPDPARTVARHRLTTEDRPVTGEVKGCRPA